MAAQHNLLGGDDSAAQKRAEETMALTEQIGVTGLSGLATTVKGAALIAQGRNEEGIAGMRRGKSPFRATGGTPLAWLLFLLASGLGMIGRPEEGLQVVEEGFASVAKTGEQFGSPLLHHIKGELLLAQNLSDSANAELCFSTVEWPSGSRGSRSDQRWISLAQ